MEWIKIDKSGDIPKDPSFLLMDEYGMVYEGSTAFDYYDAEYWCPMPTLPNTNQPTITNDAWVHLTLKENRIPLNSLSH